MPQPRFSGYCQLLAAIWTVLLAGALWMYPLADTWLPLVLPAYALLLLWRPRWWLPALLAMLPVLDIAPRTGWFFLEEIDLLLLITAAVAYWHLATGTRQSPLPIPMPHMPPLFRASLVLMAIACGISFWRALHGSPALDSHGYTNAFNNYLSPFNALRIAKAWLWALVLLPPLKQTIGPKLQGMHELLMPGMIAGLLLVSCAAIHERIQFPGLTNFSSDYRISAPFSAMHTGGAALDGYLALACPLLAAWLGNRQASVRTLIALSILPLALYAGLATFSRGLYLAFAVAAAILLTLYLAHGRHGRHARRSVAAAVAAALPAMLVLDAAFRLGSYRGLAGALTFAAMLLLLFMRPLRLRYSAIPALLGALLVLAVAIPFYHGYFVAQRFGQSRDDLAYRMRHWRQVMGMMDDSIDTALLGMGMGTFPSVYYWRNPEREVPPSYRYMDQDYNRSLQLSAGLYNAGYGELLRMLQRVSVAPNRPYLLALDVRNPGPAAFLHLNLCERQLLYPQNCVAAPLKAIASGPYWHRIEYGLQSGVLGQAPVYLEIAAEGQGATLAIDNVSLRDGLDDHELLHNGSFSAANDYWFFSSDRHHLPWHIKNLWLNLYFDMGLLGVLAYGGMLLSSVGVLWQRSRAGDRQMTAAAMLAAIAAFHVVGMFDSLFDVPRITLLHLLLLIAAALQPSAGRSATPLHQAQGNARLVPGRKEERIE